MSTELATLLRHDTGRDHRPVGAVVTGLGIVSPIGLGVERFWAATLAGRSGIAEITRFDASGYPSRLAGEVDGFRPEEHISSRLLPQTDHMTRMALAATDWALADAGVDPAGRPEYSMSVATAASAGGFEFGQRELEKLWGRGPLHVSAYQSFAWFYAVNTGQISIRHGMRGPSGVVVGDGASGLDVIAQARRLLRRGSGLVVTGSVDSNLCPWGWVAHLAGGGVSTVDDPAAAYRPFDSATSGYVPGEGGAILVLEDRDSAGDRGYGLVAGHGATFDGPDEPPGAGLRRSAELALDDAGIGPDRVDLVLADAAGSLDLDLAEVAVLTALFGEWGVPVTAPKTMTGRLSSGSAPLDVATALLALRDGVVPPTVHVTAPHPAIDLVRDRPRPAPLSTVLVLARGRGGFNSALVVQRLAV
ncbi:MAG: ketosynthase chain-length factor [Geodermatophilaceae bacterium]